MKVRMFRPIVSAWSLALLSILFVACSSAPTTSTGTTPTATTALSTPTSSSGTTFKQFSGPGFTINYPATWQTSKRDNLGKTISSFVYSDNVTGFHVSLHTHYLDATSPVDDLTNSEMNCDPGDTSLPQTVTINGLTWFQSDMLCMLASSYYEIRLLTYRDTRINDETTIVYGAYQQSTSSPEFQKANQEYFEPMLQSFKLG